MPVVVRGLDEFRRDLKRIDPQFAKAFSKANELVGKRVAEAAKPRIKGLPSPGGSIAAQGIKGGRKQTKATITLSGSNPTLFANVLGTLSHTAWGRHRSGRGPWQPWLGNSWSPEDLYGVGPALKQTVDTFALDKYMDAVMDGLRQAFPD